MAWFAIAQAVHPAWPVGPAWSPTSLLPTEGGNAAATAGVARGTGLAYDAALPIGFVHVTITRDYDLADGLAPVGVVQFTPSTWLINNGVTVPAATVIAPLDVDGRISISLAANTGPGVTPTGSYYTVREVIAGQPQRTYRATVPHDQGLLIDLSTLT